jgi:hypothetical protein
MNYKFLNIFIALLLLQSCTENEDINGQEVENTTLEYSPSPIELNGIDVKFSKDISYGPYPKNTFDIFIPNSAEPTPLVIYIHGGGFLGGEKENPNEEIEKMINFIEKHTKKDKIISLTEVFKEIPTEETEQGSSIFKHESFIDKLKIDLSLEKEEQPIQEIEIETIEEDKILRHFNLNLDGTYVLEINESSTSTYSIPLYESDKNGFLLQGYDNGHLNKVLISTLLSRRIDREYKNGLNSQANLNFIEVIKKDEIIGIHFSENGSKKFKAHLTENISSREQLHLQGYKVIYNDFEKIEFEFLPLEIKNGISRLIYQSFNAYGKPIDNNYYETEWNTLKKFGSKQINNKPLLEQAPVASLFENIPNSLFDVKVELNSTVKIKYLNQDKVLTIKLVDYQTQGMDMKNGVQKVNIKNPIGVSIKGKSVGDRIVIENTDSIVEIIEIN